MSNHFANPFEQLLGQPLASRTLTRALSEGRVASALLFAGPSGSGKTLAANLFAKALLSANRDQASVENRIDRSLHPDLRIYKPRDEGAGNLRVETIREEIIPFVQYAPYESEAAVVVISEADICFPENHPEAANAMLKTLEEPKSNVHFVLTSSSPKRLLPTIRSRCQLIRFTPLPNDVMRTLLAERVEGASPEQVDAALSLAQGRLDRALSLLEGENLEERVQKALDFEKSIRSSKGGALVTVAETAAGFDELQWEIVSLLFRDLAALQCGAEEAVLLRSHRNALLRVAQESELSYAEMQEKIGYYALEAEANANAELSAFRLVSSLAERSPSAVIMRQRQTFIRQR